MFTLSLAYKNIARQIRKCIIAFAVCAALSGASSIYIENLQSSRAQLDILSEVIPVTARITNLNASKSTGLRINISFVDEIEGSGFAKNLVYTVQASANFAPETPEQRDAYKSISLAGVNSLAAYPSVLFDDLDSALLAGSAAECLISRDFLDLNGLKVGDFVSIAVYRWHYIQPPYESMRYEYVDDCTLTVSGEFELDELADTAAVPDIIVPIGWIRNLYEEKGIEFYADSVSFSVAEPERLNEFKAAMKELKLLSFNPQAEDSILGNALVVSDEIYIRSATNIGNNLMTLRAFFPAVLIIFLATGYIVSNLMYQSRRGELAIMRTLGMSTLSCIAVFMCESAVLSALGGLIGGFAAFYLAGASIPAAMLSVFIFVASYLAGSFVSVYSFSRTAAIDMMARAE